MHRFLWSGLAALLLCSFAVVSSGAATRAQPRWVVRELGTLGGKTSSAVAVNDRGQVIGVSSTADREEHAFLWQKGRMIDLGTLAGQEWSRPVAINEAGHVIGRSGPRAFVWKRGRLTDLGLLGDEGPCTASAIDDSGMIVGRSGGNWGRGFLWRDGTMTDLGALSGGRKSSAVAINASGQVVGWSGTAARSAEHAFLWQDGKMTDLGTLKGTYKSAAAALNDAGQIVGTSSIPYVHAVLWQRGTVVDLARSSSAIDVIEINERGQVLTARKLWERGRAIPLDFFPTKLNDRGQVIG